MNHLLNAQILKPYCKTYLKPEFLPHLLRFISLLGFLSASSTAMAAQPLLTPNELQALINEPGVRVIDIRAPKDYNQGHLPNAVNAPYGQWRGPANNPGQLPPLKTLTQLIQNLGLEPQTHAVVVSSGANDTDFGAAARVYWTLKVSGLENLSIVNGGVKAWSGAKLPLTQKLPSVDKSSYQPTLNRDLLVDQAQLLAQEKSSQAVLVDARPEAFFNGQTRHVAAKTPGTLPGAVNVAYSVWFKPGTSEVIDATKAKSVATRFDLANTDKEVVSFCNTGHWAATNWFVLSELVGDPNVKLYAGSMVDWTNAKQALPMENVPGRMKQLWIDARLWFSSL
jgi:thiosulfate/3-mercaptopyruvate sulfurtransferase